MNPINAEVLHELESRASRDGYANVEALLRDALHALDRQNEVDDWVEAKLLEAIDEETTPMTAEDWADIEREGLERIKRLRQP